MINYLLNALVTQQTRIILPCERACVHVRNYFVPIAVGRSYMRKEERSPRTGRATNNPFSRVYATPRTIDASFVEKRDQLRAVTANYVVPSLSTVTRTFSSQYRG